MKIVNIILKKLFSYFLDTLFPKMCIECGKYGNDVCLECISKIEKIKTSTCFYCGKISKNGILCVECKKRNNSKVTSIITAAVYDVGPTKEMIHYLKYCGFIDISETLGELIVERLKITDIVDDKLVVVPVPMHSKRERERGYNHAELLARYISKELKLHGGLALEKVVETKQQMGLRREKRLVNLEDSIRCVDKKLVDNRNILLVDDVSTTGATVNECAKMLKKAGAKNVFAAVVARG